LKHTVLAAGDRNYAIVIAAIFGSVTFENVEEFATPGIPVDLGPAFVGQTGTTNASFVDLKIRFRFGQYAPLTV
jgi:hypothetical protein